MFKHLKSSKAFTLVEMLIVIGILAVLVAVVVSILNPAEFFRQTRDSRRLSDLNQLDQALNLATLDNVFMGTANVVYVSIPDDISGTATSTCLPLGLPAILGWTYQCSNSTNYRKVNGTGWIPVNFSALVTVPSALTLLPIDPTNATSSNLFYTYVSGSWELTSLFESTKYQTNYKGFGTSTVYTSGNHQGISPNGIAMRAGSNGGGGTPSVTISTLITNTATDLAATTATLNGTITNEGGASSTIVGFQYGLTTSYGSEATSTYSGGVGSFSKGITGLTASTLYHFKAEAKNSAGWGYGGDNTLTTTDPYTKLLLHMDGSNGGTTFTDSSPSVYTITANGGAVTSNAHYKFGTPAYSGNGTNSYLSIPDSDDWYFGIGDFTADFWVYFNTYPADNGSYVWFCSQGIQTNSNETAFFARGGGTSGWGGIYFMAASGGESNLAYYRAPGDLNAGQWYHIEYDRQGSNIYIFINGVSQTLQVLQAIGTNSIPNWNSVMWVGARKTENNYFINGYIDEFRISKGTARHTSNFTPSTAPY